MSEAELVTPRMKTHFMEIVGGETRTYAPDISGDRKMDWQSWRDPADVMANLLGGKRILEVGCGDGSAYWLDDIKCEELTSVEVDPEWARAALIEDSRHRMVLSWKGEPAAIKELIFNHNKATFDGGLVDGINENRVMCVNLLLHLGMVRWLLIHDFGEKDKGYNWEWIVVPDGWTIMRYTGHAPHTGIAFKDADAAIVKGAFGGKIEDV